MVGVAEDKIAVGVLKIAAAQANGIATFRRLRKEIPSVVKLNDADLAPSATRPGEPMWHQIVRNIKSHHTDEGNAIAEGWLTHVPRVGYAITPAGRKKVGP